MLSIVIVNWNTCALLQSCLDSISHTECSEPVETIVVDNFSSDGSSAMVLREFPGVKLLANAENSGYAAGNNQGIGTSRSEFVLTLNPDTELHSTSLDVPLSILKEDLTVGCVGIRQIGLNGETQSSVRGFPSVIGIVGDLLHLRFGPFDSYRLSKFDYEKEQTAPQPMGTFLMFRRSALQEVGDPACPFDEQFPIFFNEVDLLHRLNEKGFRCVYTPRATVLHHGGESTKQVRPKMIWESHRSLLRYWKKYALTSNQKITLQVITPLVFLGALIRARSFHREFRA